MDSMDISQEEMNATIKAMQELMKDISFDNPTPKFVVHMLDSDELYHLG
jgi:hypothetical protein